ncbi:helix-turn-helix transcriptional regulator [Enterobacter ludwigii]|uniref:helix-turn-helix domain-containing protein n=1 Tax=Enterobacter ludwigii TaxID=299767 RepID=UPI0024332F6F|nr:helix-turn-helix transcriptional regulator [Enterobacter ludwigii]WGA02956.1 helix-turn-helix transcriptional regulator [Enterobacter ludwigii]
MTTLGYRLREERSLKGLNQTEFAALAGGSRGAQAAYERDEKIPGGAYLAALAAAGVDILYVLTGQRAPLPDRANVESEEERRLLENYRAMDEAAKLNIQAVGDAFAQSSGSIKKNSA